MKSKLSATLAICFFTVFSSISLAADITVSSSSTTRNFNSNDQKIIIAAGGDLTGSMSNPTIYGDGFTGSQIIVNANSGNGVSSLAEAITLNNSTLTDLSLNSGRITAAIGGSTTGTIYLVDGQAGTNNITVASGTTISNTYASGGTAIHYKNGSNDANLVINNSGTISSINHSASNAILFEDSSSGSVLTVNNTGGTITGGAGNAINVLNGNSATINNSGTITGAIRAATGDIDIVNTAGTITGAINLGTNSGSSLAVSGGSVIGDLTFGNSAQTLNVTADGFFSGAINNTGIVRIVSDS